MDLICLEYCYVQRWLTATSIYFPLTLSTLQTMCNKITLFAAFHFTLTYSIRVINRKYTQTKNNRLRSTQIIVPCGIRTRSNKLGGSSEATAWTTTPFVCQKWDITCFQFAKLYMTEVYCVIDIYICKWKTF